MANFTQRQLTLLARIARGDKLTKQQVRSLTNRGIVRLSDPLDPGFQWNVMSGPGWKKSGPRFFSWTIVCPDAQAVADRSQR